MHKDLKTSVSRFWQIGESFAIQKPNLRVVWVTCIFLISYLVIGELFFRVDTVQAALTEPRLGSRHRQFEIQLGRLDRLVRAGEPIDCIFLGNSMTWLGIDPLVVDDVFQNRTGEQIHCFNFGVSALPASSAGLIAPLLVEKYHPKFLIYGTFARDYAIPIDAEDASVINETPWLAYQQGDFNLLGWAYEHSYVLRYKGHMRDFLYMNSDDLFIDKTAPDYRAYGLDPKYDIRSDVKQSPDLGSSDNRDPVKWLTTYTIQQENLEGLHQVVELSGHGVQVIVLEMPFYETAFDFFANGETDYQSYVRQVEQTTKTYGTLFWRLQDQPYLSPEDWWDYFHLNIDGVNVFSEWLGNQLADTYLQGELKLLSSNKP